MSCTGKARFASETEARQAIRPGLTTTYLCDGCKAWHLGLPPATHRVGARKLRRAVHYGKR